MNEQTELLREIRDLLLVVAEPSLAKRDERLRHDLREIVGKSKPKAKAVLLMDGVKTQTAIGNESSVDSGNLSRLIKGMREVGLIGKDATQNPKLVITIPANFFDEEKAK